MFTYGLGIIEAMKGNVLKATKAAAHKQKKAVSSKAAVMQRKVKQTFAAQVDALARCRFQGHRDRCLNATGGGYGATQGYASVQR